MNTVFALVLIAIGVVGYLKTARVSITALIPAFFGLIVLVLTLLAWFRPSWGTGVQYAAIGLSVLGFLATARGLSALPGFIQGHGATKPAALAKALMAISCLAFAVCAVFGL